MFANWQKFSAWALDYKPEYLHGGHLIDRVGYKEFVKHIFEGVEFNPEAKMADDIFWAENEQRGNMHVMPLSEHKHAAPRNRRKRRHRGFGIINSNEEIQTAGGVNTCPAVFLPFCAKIGRLRDI